MKLCSHINALDIEKVAFNIQDVVQVVRGSHRKTRSRTRAACFSRTARTTPGSASTYATVSQENCSLIISEFDGGPSAHFRKNGHKIMMNAHTTECFCLECGAEIHDLEVYSLITEIPGIRPRARFRLERRKLPSKRR